MADPRIVQKDEIVLVRTMRKCLARKRDRFITLLPY
jgi:hypothetical protein